jgi:hypothetical protein
MSAAQRSGAAAVALPSSLPMTNQSAFSSAASSAWAKMNCS